MRRPLRSALAAALSLAALAALYAGYWYRIAGSTGQAIEDWAAARRAEGLTVGWDGYRIGGFPLWIRVEVAAPVFARTGADPSYQAGAPTLVGTARPWSPQIWLLSAPSAHISVDPGPLRPAVKLKTAQLQGRIAPREAQDGPGAMVLDLSAAQIGATVAATHISAATAEASLDLPAGPLASHLDTWLAGALRVSGLRLPAAVPPLGDTIDRVSARLAVKGTIPKGKPRDALDAWRRDGGTLELESLALDWGELAVTASGTLALDADLQPIGAFHTEIGGYDQVVDALTQAGTLRAGDAALAKVALGVLARTGSDGRSTIAAPVSLQNGMIYLGPVKLARLPVFTWQ